MPLTLLDIGLLVVMLISGILAMVRGFMREVLSIAAWLIAAVVTLYFYARVETYLEPYIANELVTKAVAIGGLFLLTLLVVSLFTVKLSDLILDSRIGALDRSLGFLFGLGRGLIIMVVAFLFFAWLVPAKSQPDWVSNARSKAVLVATGDWLLSILPDDPETAILRRLRNQPDDEDALEPLPQSPVQPANPASPVRPVDPVQPAPEETPGRSGWFGWAPRVAAAEPETSYGRSARQSLEQLLESARSATH